VLDVTKPSWIQIRATNIRVNNNQSNVGYSKRSTHDFGFMAMTPQFDFDHFNRPQIVVIPKI
jgi:hypothetical protein